MPGFCYCWTWLYNTGKGGKRLQVTPEEGREFATRIGAIFAEIDHDYNGFKELVCLIYLKKIEAKKGGNTAK
jgi:hypothetical protein